MHTRAMAPPAQGNNPRQSKAYALFVVAGLLVMIYPAALVGAAAAFAVWRATKTDLVSRWLIAGLSAVVGAGLEPTLDNGWTWGMLAHMVSPANNSAPTLSALLATAPAEMLLGPLILVGCQLGIAYRRDTVHGEEWHRFNQEQRRKQALERTGVQTNSTKLESHPVGKIRLGVAAEDGRPFDIAPEELAQHVFLPGASGSGKTTTIVRLADGALSNGYSVVIVDCKGVGFGVEAQALASRHNVPFTFVDPLDASTVGYDPCTGEAASIANKLIGAFSFSDEAEIYKHVAMEVIPVICRAMMAAHTPITLSAMYQTLGRGGLARLGRSEGAQAYRDRLEALEDAGGVGTAGYIGLQKRFGALMEGTFGGLFHTKPALDWQRQMAEPQVTYLSLSAMAASEDVQLFGRVITQDLKQICDQRMRAMARGENPPPRARHL